MNVDNWQYGLHKTKNTKCYFFERKPVKKCRNIEYDSRFLQF